MLKHYWTCGELYTFSCSTFNTIFGSLYSFSKVQQIQMTYFIQTYEFSFQKEIHKLKKASFIVYTGIFSFSFSCFIPKGSNFFQSEAVLHLWLFRKATKHSNIQNIYLSTNQRVLCSLIMLNDKLCQFCTLINPRLL